MGGLLSQETPRASRLTVIVTLVALIVGLLTGWAIGKFIKIAKVQSLSWSDVAALALAMVFIALGLLITVLSVARRGRAILAYPVAPEFGRPVKAAQTAFFLMQAGVLILAGVMLAAPIAFVKAVPGGQGLPLMVAILAGFVLQTVLNLLIWRRSDEVFRLVIAESGAASFWLLQGAFFLWACGERLNLLAKLSSWDAVTVLMAVYLMTSTLVACRRGIR